MQRRRIALALALLVGFGLQVAYASPARTTDELRAISCCANHCQNVQPPARPRDCCHIERAHDGPAVNAAVPKAPPPAMSTAVCGFRPAPRLEPIGEAASIAVRDRAAPVFLLNRSFRL